MFDHGRQSDHLPLSSMLYESSSSVTAEVALLEDHTVTEYVLRGALVRLGRIDVDLVGEALHDRQPGKNPLGRVVGKPDK